jgi:uncharacterized membrane protein
MNDFNKNNSAPMQDNTKVFAILSYIGILFIVGLIADPKNERLKFHINQGIVLFITEIILWVAVAIITAILGWIPIVGWILIGLITFAVWAAILVLMILGIVNAAKGEEKPLPVIGGFKIYK